MANATLLTQLLSDPAATAKTTKKGGMNFATLLGDPTQAGANAAAGLSSVQAFQNLLTNVLNGNKATAATPTVLVDGKGAALPNATKTDPTLEDLLKGLPPEIAAVLRAQAALNTGTTLTDLPVASADVINALSVVGPDGKKLVPISIISDPELAAALEGLTTQLQAIKGDVDINALMAGTLNTENLSETVLKAAQKIASQLETLNGKTITIADLTLDGFQALKKVAFADIAPFLTQPRTVVLDSRAVVKISQGPAFLNDEGTDIVTLVLNAGLVPAVPEQNVISTIVNPLLQPGLAVTPGTAETAAAAPAMAPLLAAATVPVKGTAKQSTTPQLNAATDDGTFVPTGAATPTTTAVPATAPVTGATAAAQNAALRAAGTSPKTETTATNSTSRGFGDMVQTLTTTAGDVLSSPGDDGLQGFKITADATQPGNSATNLMAARSAGQPHPGTHLVSVALSRNINPHTPGMEKEISIQMDPGNLGRVRITLQFGENNKVKAKLVAESPETLALLQKDAGALERTLTSSGLDVSAADSLSFSLGQGDSFSQSMRDPNGSQHGKNKSAALDGFGTDNANIETVMNIFVDPATGLTHVNVVI